MSILEEVIKSAADYQKLYPHDNCIVITDADGKILLYQPAKSFDMHMKEGEIVSPNGSTAEYIRT
ncbi:MAG: hypothetical protein H6Q67_758 [Firmicutes bacterium]|nr:hypothetical protein [Bacillota bacterium]